MPTPDPAAPAAIIFQDSFGAAPNTRLDAIGYVPTTPDGKPGSGSWIGGYAGRITAAHRVVRSSGGGSGELVLIGPEPPSRLYSIEADLFLASIGPDNDRTFLISHYNGGLNGLAYQFGLDIQAGKVAVVAWAGPAGLNPDFGTPVPGATAGDTFRAAMATASSRSDLVVSFYLRRIGGSSGDGHYLINPSGTYLWQAERAAFAVAIDRSGTAKGRAGFWTYIGDPNDAAGIQIGNFVVTDQSDPATGLTFTGPGGGDLGAASSAFTLSPDGTYTGTITPRDGGRGGSFTPTSLTWTNDPFPKIFTYTPAVDGAIPIGLEGATLPVAPASLTYTVTAGALLGSVEVDPTGKLLLLKFTGADGTSPAHVTAVRGGATYRVNGGPPVPLTDPIWAQMDDGTYRAAPADAPNWMAYPLCGALQVAIADDKDPGVAWSGAWTERTKDNYRGTWGDQCRWDVGSRLVYGDAFRESSDPAARARYRLDGLKPGTWRLSYLLEVLWGPDRTKAAKYAVYDGDGTTPVDTFTLDQTIAPPFDRNDLGYHLADFPRPVTISGTSLTIEVSNAGASGTVLATDALWAEYVQTPPFVPKDTVTVSAPVAAFVTHFGPAAMTTDRAVARTTDADLMPFDAAGPHTMKVGYNKYVDGFGNFSLLHADRAKGGGYWTINSGTGTIDPATGGLASLDGVAQYILFSGSGSGDDTRNTENLPDGCVLTCEFQYAGPGTPAVDLVDATDAGCSFDAKSLVHGTGDTWTLTQTYHRKPFVPLSLLGGYDRAWIPSLAYLIALRTTSLIAKLRVYDAATMAADPTHAMMTHPSQLRRFRGKGFGAMRFLDCFPSNGSNIAEYGDFPDPTRISVDVNGRETVRADVASIDPVDTTPADVDEVLTWASPGFFHQFPWIKVTTKGPHGLRTGPKPHFEGTLSGPFPATRGGDLALGGSMMIVVRDDRTFLMMIYQEGPHGPVPITLAGTHPQSGLQIVLNQGSGVPMADMVRFAAETGIPGWYNIPHAVTPDCSGKMCDAVLAGTPPGQKTYVELSNEFWNFSAGFEQSTWFINQAVRLRALHARDPVANPADPRSTAEAYAELSNREQVRWRAKFAAAGRANDLVWVMGSLQAGSGVSGDICDYAHRRGFTFDAIAPGAYVNFQPFGGWGGDPAATFRRLDTDARVSLLALNLLSPDTNKLVADLHLATLRNPKYGGTFDRVKLVSYESGLAGMDAPGDDRTIQRIHQMVRDPRVYTLTLAWHQAMERQGWALINRYTLDYVAAVTGTASWVDVFRWDQVGYDPDNPAHVAAQRNPWDVAHAESVEFGARTRFASYAPGTSLPPPQPAPPTPTQTPTPTPPPVNPPSPSPANRPPVLGVIADLTMPAHPATRVVTLPGSDPDGDPLTYTAQAVSLAYALAKAYGLSQYSSVYDVNYRGQREKYLRGPVSAHGYTDPGGLYYYFLTPAGDLFEYTPPYGDKALHGVPVAHLGSAYYDDPTLLTAATAAPPPVTLAVACDRLTIAPGDGFAGTFVVVATVGDGRADDCCHFRVTVESPPTTPSSSPALPIPPPVPPPHPPSAPPQSRDR